MAKLYVVRHAHAGTGDPRDPDDSQRELTERGWKQAAGLRDLLADVGITRLVASPFPRCRQTLEPLAEALGIEVEADERLAEGTGFVGAIELAAELRDTPAAICSHGDVIPDLLEALLRRGLKVKGDVRWPKASTWVLTRAADGDGFTRGRFLPPPPV